MFWAMQLIQFTQLMHPMYVRANLSGMHCPAPWKLPKPAGRRGNQSIYIFFCPVFFPLAPPAPPRSLLPFPCPAAKKARPCASPILVSRRPKTSLIFVSVLLQFACRTLRHIIALVQLVCSVWPGSRLVPLLSTLPRALEGLGSKQLLTNKPVHSLTFHDCSLALGELNCSIPALKLNILAGTEDLAEPN